MLKWICQAAGAVLDWFDAPFEFVCVWRWRWRSEKYRGGVHRYRPKKKPAPLKRRRPK